MEFKDRTGDRIGAMTVTSKFSQKLGSVFWLCKCDCGGERWLGSNMCDIGEILDCGCGAVNKKRGGQIKYDVKDSSKSKEYNVWSSMKNRCTNQNNKKYKNYGGRGITVCEEWMESFDNFYKDMGEKPFKNAQLDRINNDDGYYKDNCRWITSRQNSWNSGAKNSENSTSKYKGVMAYMTPTCKIKYKATISKGSKPNIETRHKTFNTEIEAAEWYNEQAKELFGEYAYLNKIDYSEKE